MYKKTRKDILKRNLTLCIVFAMYIALMAAMAVFECYFSMIGVKSCRMACKLYVLLVRLIYSMVCIVSPSN